MSENKKRILCLKAVLEKYTDENHYLTRKEIEEKLYLEYQLSKVNRNTFNNDIKALENFNVYVEKIEHQGKPNKYAILEGIFSLAEIKMLVDTIQASRFITCKKSQILIDKLGMLTNKYNAEILQRNVFVKDRVKSMNESIFYNIDAVYRGIREKRKVSFVYINNELSDAKNKRGEYQLIPKLRNNGNRYLISPYCMIWSNEHYYIVAHYEKYDKITHFRVDRMKEIKVENEKAIPCENEADFQEGAYSNRYFRMYNCDIISATLRLDNNLTNVVADRFGDQCRIIEKEEKTFTINVEVSEAPTFFGWLAMFEGQAEVIRPKSLKDQYKEHLKKALESQRKDD